MTEARPLRRVGDARRHAARRRAPAVGRRCDASLVRGTSGTSWSTGTTRRMLDYNCSHSYAISRSDCWRIKVADESLRTTVQRREPGDCQSSRGPNCLRGALPLGRYAPPALRGVVTFLPAPSPAWIGLDLTPPSVGLLAAARRAPRECAPPTSSSSASRLPSALACLGLGVRVVLAAEQLDLGHLGAVTPTVAETQHARVAARPLDVPRRDGRRTASGRPPGRRCRAPRSGARSPLRGLPASALRLRLATEMIRSTNGRSSLALRAPSSRSARAGSGPWSDSGASRCDAR